MLPDLNKIKKVLIAVMVWMATTTALLVACLISLIAGLSYV